MPGHRRRQIRTRCSGTGTGSAAIVRLLGLLPGLVLLALPLAARSDPAAPLDAHSLAVLRLPATTAGAMMHGVPPPSAAPLTSTFDPTEVDQGMPAGMVGPVIRQTPALGGSLLIEMPRVNSDGTIQQPRFALGFESTRMRSMLQDIGIEATQCMAPVVRGRAHLGSQPSAQIILSLRCTIR